jgi:hypothetical protein
MGNYFGKNYYIDFDRIIEECEIKKNEEGEGLEINVFKYEIIKMCLQRIIEDGYDDDDNGGIGSFSLNSQSISFRMALHTLIKNKIILEYEDEE